MKTVLFLIVLVAIVFANDSFLTGKRKSTKREYLNCVHDTQCYAINCDPSGKYAESCLQAKRKYMHCSYSNQYCSQVPDIIDVLLWNEPMPEQMHKCYSPEQCGADINDSYEYYTYQNCFKKCLWQEY